MSPRLPTELETAVQGNLGIIRVEGDRTAYVVMTLQAYRELSGAGTNEDLADSLCAIQEGLADIDAGRSRPFRDVLAELSQRNDLRR